MEVTDALRLEISLGTLSSNLAALKTLTDAKICAVVKADAYGHGSRALNAFDKVDEFAVSSIGEAIEVSEHSDKPINILSMPDKTVEAEYIDGIIPAVSDVDDLEFVSKHGAKNINVKINTGMNRYGAGFHDLEQILKKADNMRIKLKSVFSHIYDISAARQQFEKFVSCIKPIEDYIPQKHILSSNFTVLPKYMHLDMVRPGIVLYGYGHELVKSAIVAKCGITQVREVDSDENIGYGICKSGKKRAVAILGAGYADGCRRAVGNSPRYVSIAGNMCPILGRICMDAMMADVSGLDVKAGDEAYVLCDNYNAEAIATSCGTISYEILTGFGKRVPREYLRE